MNEVRNGLGSSRQHAAECGANFLGCFGVGASVSHRVHGPSLCLPGGDRKDSSAQQIGFSSRPIPGVRTVVASPDEVKRCRGLAPLRLCLSDLRRSIPYKFRALMIMNISPGYVASYPLPVRQASALPLAFSRFAVARDTLAVQPTLLLSGE